MSKKTPTANMQKLQAKEQRQEKTIERYKKQARWITWAVIAILLLILFFVLSMGYASNWWQNPTRTSQFSPLGTDSSQSGGVGTQTTGSVGSTGTDTTTNTNNTTRETTSVTNNNTTITPAPPASTPTPQPSQRLLTLNSNIATGEDIEATINLANSLGVGVNCRIELLVRICDFTDGQFTITTKNLITGGGITGISLNF